MKTYLMLVTVLVMGCGEGGPEGCDPEACRESCVGLGAPTGACNHLDECICATYDADTDAEDGGTEAEAETTEYLGPDADATDLYEPVCGNWVVEPGEVCDSSYDGDPCTTVCGSTGVLSCPDCLHMTCVPQEEACNWVDDNCDGRTDEGLEQCNCTHYDEDFNQVVDGVSRMIMFYSPGTGGPYSNTPPDLSITEYRSPYNSFSPLYLSYARYDFIDGFSGHKTRYTFWFWSDARQADYIRLGEGYFLMDADEVVKIYDRGTGEYRDGPPWVRGDWNRFDIEVVPHPMLSMYRTEVWLNGAFVMSTPGGQHDAFELHPGQFAIDDLCVTVWPEGV